MRAVHVGRDQQHAQCAFETCREAKIGVREQAEQCEADLERQHGDPRRAEQHDHRELEQLRQQYLARVETQAGGHVELDVAVMNPMQRPQPGNFVQRTVLRVQRQVQQQPCEQGLDQRWRVDMMEKPEVRMLRPQRAAEQAQLQQHRDDQTDRDQRQVRGPTQQTLRIAQA